MFTDIEGFTRLTSGFTRKDVDILLRVQHKIVETAITAFGGHIIKNLGDGYMIVFESPTNAVLAGLEMQRAVARHNKIPSDKHFRMRIGLNSGDVQEIGGDVFGEPVNMAARICAVARSDSVFLSNSVYLTMNKSEIAVVPFGEKVLKGITEPVTIYQAIVEPVAAEKKLTRRLMHADKMVAAAIRATQTTQKRRTWSGGQRVSYGVVTVLAGFLILVSSSGTDRRGVIVSSQQNIEGPEETIVLALSTGDEDTGESTPSAELTGNTEDAERDQPPGLEKKPDSPRKE